MDFNMALKKLNENVLAHMLHAYKEWCDENDEYVKDPKALVKFIASVKTEVSDAMQLQIQESIK